MLDNQTKLYLLDANVIIHAHDYYYNMARVPEFWEWILHHAENGLIKMPVETMDEVQGGPEAKHAQWIRSQAVRDQLLLDEDFDEEELNHVVTTGYQLLNPTEDDIEMMGQDPFLITYALGDANNRIIISNEISKPSTNGAKRKVPDVCTTIGVECYDVYHLLRVLDFSTNWAHKV